MSGPRLRRFTSGQPVRSLRNPLNAIVDRLNGDDTPRGSTGAYQGLLPQAVIRLQIRDINTSDLTCVVPGNVLQPSAQTWTVTLPPTLTESSRDGVSYVYTDINNRTADGTETQKMTPLYIINDYVYVATVVAEGAYVDLNVDGRQWARVP